MDLVISVFVIGQAYLFGCIDHTVHMVRMDGSIGSSWMDGLTDGRMDT